ncbi:hypothetical protein [Puerhibacterium sp. TATVAM-FAB25]|uniref:hypothetical protein n=1 Tax=Puerhibacterium sp. TATVAM-FAB25 TaxID=3093699 RepID=UPI00397BAD66
MVQGRADQTPGVGEALLRSRVFWVATAAGLLTSPMLFWSAPAAGIVIALVGTRLWITRRRIFLVALGTGLAAGSVPYAIAALLTLLDIRWP